MKGSRDLGVFTALVANKAPNIRCLHLPVSHFWDTPFIQLFGHNPEFLSNLESVWIESDEEYQKLLTLPKVKSSTFKYGALSHDYFCPFPSSWLPGTLETEKLAFHHCAIHPFALKKMMQACKKLKAFTYSNFSLDPDKRRRAKRLVKFNAKQAYEAVLLHKDTLELFHLDYTKGFDIFEHTLYGHIEVGSFRDFPVLETIVITHDFLPPHPEFPSSLKTLHIMDCKSSVGELARNIADDCENGLYPMLTDVSVFAFDITHLPLSYQCNNDRSRDHHKSSESGNSYGEIWKFTLVPSNISSRASKDCCRVSVVASIMVEFGYEEDFQEPPRANPSMDAIPPYVLDLLMERTVKSSSLVTSAIIISTIIFLIM
ncbi:uncharacterized protein N7518_003043 [Penicillium psychrosexuale]|uniref:uncharacterized protein n=1 Tax=Penicillium psychrosexuale TaxID=1002107 RepID=UPI0025453FE8|nr:uncharacterized protein N7518_003043 [Penicillium psychrosexuale]KAJ5800975.1 hypothetical protein N7518_003043 [Penicillium psychrosexuale]